MTQSPPLPHQTLSSRNMQLYYRMIAPLIAVMSLWGTWMNPPHAYGLVLVFCLPLLLVGLFYHAIPPRLEWGVRLTLSVVHVTYVAALICFGPALHIEPNDFAVKVILLVTPLTVLAWSFVFSDHPRAGMLLTTLLTLLAAGLLAQWALINRSQGGGRPDDWMWFFMLLTCLLASRFGWGVNQLQRQAMQLQRSVQLDVLTGLHNRHAFERVQSPEGSSGVLAVLDVDGFKGVNDTHGHLVGDRILRMIGEALLNLAPPGENAFRWGGEEFVLLMPGYSLEQGQQLVEQIRQRVASLTLNGVQVTLSGGLSVYGPLPETPLSTAFQRADSAMLAAKRAGRDRVQVWTPEQEFADRVVPRPQMNGRYTDSD